MKPGDRVKLSVHVLVETEATIEAVEANGAVVRLDPATFVYLPEDDLLALRRYYRGIPLENPDDPNLTWVGAAHFASLEKP